MKKTATVIFVLILPVLLFAQTAGDYQTRASGNWSQAQNWQRYNGSAWVNIAAAPTGSETITVLGTDSIFVDAAVAISGTLVNQGVVEPNGLLTFADGATYQHDRDGGRIPISTWEPGSTMMLTGVTAVAPNDRDQDYFNLAFNTPGLISNLNMNLKDNIIGGDVRVIDTGVSRWYLTSALAMDTSIVTIMGDVYVEAGAFSVQGTGNALTTFIVHHYGNIEVTGGNFSVSRGSQGGGTTTWYLYEGNFSMANATTQSSTALPGGAKFVFCKDSTQILTLGEGNTLTALPIEVASGTTLDMGSSIFGGSGIFTLNEGATLMTAVGGGIAEIFAGATGTVTLMPGSSFGFNGAVAQVTSALMPNVVTDLIIANPAGVTLSQETTINGVLHLVSGVFDNTIPFTLGETGSISEEGGSLLHSVAVESHNTNTPESFFIEQNYPNPFNPVTTLRFSLPAASHVSIKIFDVNGREVTTLFDGRKNVGIHKVQFHAANLSSGIYFYRIQAGDAVSMKRMVMLK